MAAAILELLKSWRQDKIPRIQQEIKSTHDIINAMRASQLSAERAMSTISSALKTFDGNKRRQVEIDLLKDLSLAMSRQWVLAREAIANSEQILKTMNDEHIADQAQELSNSLQVP
jgi:hypothetical protein